MRFRRPYRGSTVALDRVLSRVLRPWLPSCAAPRRRSYRTTALCAGCKKTRGVTLRRVCEVVEYVVGQGVVEIVRHGEQTLAQPKRPRLGRARRARNDST